MSVRSWAASLACCVAVAATPGPAGAQFGPLTNSFGFGAKRPAASARPSTHQASAVRLAQAAPTEAYSEPLPMGQMPGNFDPHVLHPYDGQIVEGPPVDGAYTEGYDSGYVTDSNGGYGSGCCESCGTSGPCDCFCPPGWDWLGCRYLSRRYFVSADYLYMRANFSEAVAFLIHDPSQAPDFLDEFHELDFEYESSFRVGGGYFLDCCDEQIRFMFTRLTSSAEDFTDHPLAVGPYETSPGPGGTLDIEADVEATSYDFDYAKTFRLGGTACGSCECGDPCGGACGCGPCCPEWAITWSGGFRFAEVDWERSYVSQNPQTMEMRDAFTTLDFRGGGPRFGLEGRRFFGPCNCASVFLKGDISLLLGDIDHRVRRVVADNITTTPDTVEVQTASFRNVIPVTEIETGLSVHMTRGISFSTGYLISAWHDLGFRDQFAFATFLETNYDDANILGFDGFFARLEACY